jgi:hypothetical protein
LSLPTWPAKYTRPRRVNYIEGEATFFAELLMSQPEYQSFTAYSGEVVQIDGIQKTKEAEGNFDESYWE